VVRQLPYAVRTDGAASATSFIAAVGDAATHRISESSYDSRTVANKLVWSQHVYNSKRRFRLYQLTRTPKTAESIFVRIGKSEAE